MIFQSCTEQKTYTTPSKSGGIITISKGIFQNSYSLNEFQYKGHIYVYCEVENGLALTHAGHCSCNNNFNHIK